MRKPHIDDRVQLTREIPELSLHKGETVVVRSIWCSPNDFYEIEFSARGSESSGRCLVPANVVRVEGDLAEEDLDD